MSPLEGLALVGAVTVVVLAGVVGFACYVAVRFAFGWRP